MQTSDPYDKDWKPTEISCGIIPFRKNEGELQVLVIQNRKDNWGFPKGHIEGNETDHQTAQRELKEESGLEVEEYIGNKDEPFISNYEFPKKGGICKKQTKLFPAWVKGQIQFKKSEAEDARWYSIPEGKEKLRHDQDKNFLAQALERLNKI